MPTFNVLERTLFIHSADYGTAFVIDRDDRQYLITAKHLLADHAAEIQTIRVYFDSGWRDLPCTRVAVCHGEVDIAVLAAPMRFGDGLPLSAAIGEFTLSQDVFFVGFPYKQFMRGASFMKRPMPFIKKGTLSAFDFHNPAKTIYLDAINNPGFSGGPIVFSSGDPGSLKVMGVVSKFRIEQETVFDAEGEPTGLTIWYNTGILVGYGMQPALDAIDRNPIGTLIGIP